MYSPMFRVKPVRVRFWGLSQSILCLTVQQADATTYCSSFGAHTAHLAFVKYCLNHNIQKVNFHYLLQIRFIMHFLTCTFPLADCIFVVFTVFSNLKIQILKWQRLDLVDQKFKKMGNNFCFPKVGYCTYDPVL